MKKLLGILVLGLLWCNTVYALPDCEGTYSKKWTNCQGTVEVEGRKYVGEFKNGKMHGQGTYTFPGGQKYVGEWKNNNRHGQGTTTDLSGAKHVGEYKNDIKHGQGTMTHADGSKYVGEYKNGKQDGQGTQIDADGGKYVGGWKNNKNHGIGTATSPDGEIFVAKHKNGEVIEIISHDTSVKDKTTKKKELASMVEDAKKTCKDLGFTEGTDKFTDCSLKLYTLSVESAAKNNQTVVMQPQSSGSNTITIYDPVRDSNALINKGMRMINNQCTFGVNC